MLDVISPQSPGVIGRVDADGAGGTAYLVARDRVVTCGHVVQYLEHAEGSSVAIRFGDRTIPATLEHLDSTGHVAVLRLESALEGAIPLGPGVAEAGPCTFAFADADAPVREGMILDVDARDAKGHPRFTVHAPALAAAMLEPDHPYSGVPVLVGGQVVAHTIDAIADPNDPTRSFLGLVECAPVIVLRVTLAEHHAAWALPADSVGPNGRPAAVGAAPTATPVPERPRLFLSYRAIEDRRHNDEDFAKALVDRLDELGYDTFMAPQILYGGNEFSAAYSQAAKRARVGLLLFSERWLREPGFHVHIEPLLKRARKKPEELSLILAQLDETAIPTELSDVPQIDLTAMRLKLDKRESPSWEAVQALSERVMAAAGTPGEERPGAGPGLPTVGDSRPGDGKGAEAAAAVVRRLGDELMEHLSAVRKLGKKSGRPNPRSIRALALRWLGVGLGGSDIPVEAARLLMSWHDHDAALEILERAREDLGDGPVDRDRARVERWRGAVLEELGRTDEAIEALNALAQFEPLDAWAGGILASAYKRKWIDLGRRRRSLLLQAYQVYRDTYARTLHYYPGINAATLAHLLGQDEEAKDIAGKLRDELQSHDDLWFWDEATLGEARLLLGEYSQALGAYHSAVIQALAQNNQKALISMRRQVDLILGKATDENARSALEELHQLFNIGHVAAFVGHPVDRPGSDSPPLFPPHRERGVRHRVRGALERLDISAGFCGGEAGADILFAEAVLQRSGSVEVFLPYPRKHFRESLGDDDWKRRFDWVLDHERTEVTELSASVPVGAEAMEVARIQCAARALDEAIRHARFLDEDATLIAFREREARDSRVERTVQAARDEGLEVEEFTLDGEPGGGEGPGGGSSDSEVLRSDPEGSGGGGLSPREQPTSATPGVDVRALNGLSTPRTGGPEPGQYRKKHLLVVGVDGYKHWNRLANARNDAQGFAEVLTERFGFELSDELYDEAATKTAIEAAFVGGLAEGTGRSGKVEPDDLVVFFFAGHGQTDRLATNDEEIGFLVPWEARRVGRADLLRISNVREWTDDLAARHVLFIFDSCFSGLATTGGGGGGRQGFARLVITAGQPEEEVADGGEWPNHSIFTGRMLQGLSKDLPTPVRILRLADYMLEHVPQDAKKVGFRQTPSYGLLPSHGGGSILLPETTRGSATAA